MNEQALKIASVIRSMLRKGKLPDNAPKGLPAFGENTDKGNDVGTFEQEGLIDPGIQNMVTGNGGGPVLGGNRARTGSRS